MLRCLPHANLQLLRTTLPTPPPNPNHAGTRITSSNECPRRSFLDERVAGDGGNDKAVKGTLQHNLIQVRRLAGGKE